MTQRDWDMLLGFPREWDPLGDIEWWMMGPAPRKVLYDSIEQQEGI